MLSTPVPFADGVQPPRGGLKVLLAEDNETNQVVAQLILEGLGHGVAIAGNGRIALEQLAAEPFDVVLMDCQMPEMDGYEATRQIRSGSLPGVDCKIPVIALTAYAVDGDPQRVIEAGMDDHIQKPVSQETLQAALGRCGLVGQTRRSGGATPVSAEAQPQAVSPKENPSKEPAFDPAQRTKLLVLRSSTGETVWARAIGVFLKEMPVRLANLMAHVEGRKGGELGAVAHTLAGSAASIGGPALRTAALALEKAAKADDWDNAPRLLSALLAEWGRLMPYLNETAQ